MSSPADIASRSVFIEGYSNPVAYDQDHDIANGYWICKVCHRSFFSGGEPLHNPSCSLKEKNKSYFVYKDQNMVYVLGSKADGRFSPFKKENIENVKMIARSKL